MQAPRQPGKATKIAYSILGKPPKERKDTKQGVIQRNREQILEQMVRTERL